MASSNLSGTPGGEEEQSHETERTCPDCKGSGIQWRTADDPCESCGGEGVVLYL